MSFRFLWSGMILGFSIAAPVGPIGILCIRKTLQFGRLSGFCSGLGAAVADMFYGAIAAFGLTMIAHLFLAGQFWLHLIGGIFLIYLGAKTFLSKPAKNAVMMHRANLLKDFVSTFFLTMTNPMTIISYLAIFAGWGITNTKGNYLNATWLVMGVFVGSGLWWLILSEIVTLFRKKVSRIAMIWINRFAGAIIIGFGLFSLFLMRTIE